MLLLSILCLFCPFSFPPICEKFRPFQIVLADHDWTTRRESQDVRFNVAKIIRHPRFDRAAKFDYDFALLRLHRPIDFAQRPDIRPVCLPEPGDDFSGRDALVGKEAVASGWGVLDPLAPNTQARKLQVGCVLP